MRFIDFFAGVGGFRRGLELSGHRCVGFCEWDKYATASYTSMHLIKEDQRKTLESMTLRQRQKEILKDEYRNGEWYASDIMGVDAGSLPDADCWTFGAPCQDFSIAGKRAGLEGDRSSLVGQIFRLLEEIGEDSEGKKKNKPEWLIYENVTGMFSTNSGIDYLQIISEMDRLGYDIQWQNMHTEWYLPQHRERIYTVGHLRGRGRAEIFPITGTDGENSISIIGTTQPHRHSTGDIHDTSGVCPTILSRGAKQMKQVAIQIKEDFLLPGNNYNQRKLVHGNGSLSRTVIGCGHSGNEPKVAVPVIDVAHLDKNQNGRRFKENGEPMFTLTAQDRHGVAIKVKEATKKGYAIANEGDSINLSVPESKTRRGRVGKGVAQTLDTSCNQGVIVQVPAGYSVYAVWYEKYQCYIAIRKLTPKECFRLQGWSDEYFERAALVNSDSQLYKQAGNGVSVPVVKAIGDKIAEFERKRFAQCMNKPESEEL